MKHIKYLGFAVFLSLLAACSPMDSKYSQFVEDGPIIYIAKVIPDSVTVNGGRNRVQLSWPQSSDPRGKKATIYWSNRMEKKEIDVNPDGRTQVIIDELAEGTYIFEIIVFDGDGNSSIPITKPGEVFGDNYERYLINRAITNINSTSGTEITFAKVIDTTIVKTDIEWVQDGIPSSATIDLIQNTVKLPDFKALSFKYRTTYLPVGGIDLFYSPYSYYLSNVKPETVVFSGKKFTFPIPNDGYWRGYVLSWIDKTTGEEKSYEINGNEAVINEYNGREVTYRAVFNIDGSTLYSSVETLTTVSYDDLDRAGWTCIISHPLPLQGATGSDALNSPTAHIDNDVNTYLSVVKPEHALNGVTVPAGEVVYFILDMGSKQKFNYFRIKQRGTGGNVNLRVYKVSFYGSNDGTNFTPIQVGVDIPNAGTLSATESGNLLIKETEYRYVKMTYDQWTVTSNTMQIAEFYLGIVE
ncbi:MAG: discoidin domain-containing protein [Dysgonamonadaceae bacterium]|nr:discoidin domain-containing protein [Dysgonamonadaceae bacterium]